jgi:hypothetical protein
MTEQTSPLSVTPQQIRHHHPESPSIEPHRVHDSDATVARYGDPRWPLAAMGSPAAVKPGVLTWTRFPQKFQRAFRRAAWLLINTEAPAYTINRPGSSGVEWFSASTIRTTVMYDWLNFAQWVDDSGFEMLSQLTTCDLEHFVSHLQNKDIAAGTASRTLRSLTRLWAHAPHMPAEDAIPAPPWDDDSGCELLARDRRGENRTRIIHPATMAPLLLWARRFLTLADDIAAATTWWNTRLAQVPPCETLDATIRAIGLVHEWINSGTRSLPARMYHGQPCWDVQYLSALHDNMNPSDLSRALRDVGHDFTLDLDAPRPVGSPITATIDGAPWCEYIDYRDLTALQRSVQAACLVLVCYLTGMRPHEALALEPGCCRTSRDGGTVVYTIRGRKYKRVRCDGKSDPEGVARTWTTIKPVATAIATAEKAFPNEKFLFAMWRNDDHALDPVNFSKRIATLVTTANAIGERLGLPDAYTIPADPAGAITLRRFRRTLAWHIRRLPQGKVALAIQYGHLTIREGEGYTGLKTDGFASMMDTEHLEAIVDSIERTRSDLAASPKVSGPAAQRLISTLERAPQFSTTFLTTAELKRVKRDTTLRVYDNPQRYLTCLFNPDRAACAQPMRPSTEPRLDHCVASCPNIARTDRQIDDLRAEAHRLHQEAASPMTPEPIAHRLTLRAQDYEATIGAHEARAITAPESVAGTPHENGEQ